MWFPSQLYREKSLLDTSFSFDYVQIFAQIRMRETLLGSREEGSMRKLNELNDIGGVHEYLYMLKFMTCLQELAFSKDIRRRRRYTMELVIDIVLGTK